MDSKNLALNAFILLFIVLLISLSYNAFALKQAEQVCKDNGYQSAVSEGFSVWFIKDSEIFCARNDRINFLEVLAE